MTTSSGLLGQESDQYAPYQTDPTPNPGTIQVGMLDPSHFQQIRGPVLTDEGGFREMLAVDPFNAPPWTKTIVGVGSIVVAAGTATFASGLTANGRTFVSIPADFLPLQINLSMVSVARPGVANTPDFFFGFYSDSDPDAAIATGEFVEEVLQGSTIATTGLFRSGAGGNLQTTSHTITSSATAGFRTVVMDGESCQIRDGTTTLPTTTTRATHSIKMPGLTTELYFACGFRNPAAPAAAWSVQIQCFFLKNSNRLIVNTAW